MLKDLSSLYELSIDDLLAETKQATQQKEGTKSMKHINFLALFSVIFFNITLFSGVAIIAIALLPLAQKITFSLYEFFVRYIKYNQKTIYN